MALKQDEAELRQPPGARRRFGIEEHAEVPLESTGLGYGALVPMAICLVASWLFARPAGYVAYELGLLWAAAILVFLGGVRRGLSFRTPGGVRIAELATMGWYFSIGLATALLVLVKTDFAWLPPAAAALGFLSVAWLDPPAARRGAAPLFFLRLRPVQMSLAALIAAGFALPAAF